MGAKRQSQCDHIEGAYFYPCVNEDGWKCVDCGAKLGFRPDLDRLLTYIKVSGILSDLFRGKLIYVANGSAGEAIATNIVGQCRAENTYDQLSILRFIVIEPNVDAGGHAEFWQKKAEAWLMDSAQSWEA